MVDDRRGRASSKRGADKSDKLSIQDKAVPAAAAGSINQDLEDSASRSSESYVCVGHFHVDFRRLCARNSMAQIPEVKPRPHRPLSPPPPPAVEEKSKAGKGGRKEDKNQPPPPDPEPEQPLLDENGEPIDPPPKTYTTKERFEYFRPCIQVEMDHPDKLDTVTEVYIRGWKVDVPMMTVLTQCWITMNKLHTISLWKTGLDDETLELFAAVIHECTGLKTLLLDNNNSVKSESWHLLLNDTSPVQNMSLRYCGITDVGAESLGKTLGTTEKQNQKLLSLNLAGNKITDRGAEHIANGLRMNRTLLVLNLSGNLIENDGATKLAEVVSRFSLTHEEIVARRKLLSVNVDHKLVSPVSSSTSSKKVDSHDRPPSSVRSQTSSTKSTSKGTTTKSKKGETKGSKDDDAKHEKTSKRDKSKDNEKTSKKGSSTTDSTKSNSRSKLETSSKKTGGKKGSAQIEPENVETLENPNPLLEPAEHIVNNGELLLQGNLTLISLNLSDNRIESKGIGAFLKALQYQTTLIEFAAAAAEAASKETLMAVSSTKHSSKGEPLVPKVVVPTIRIPGTGLMHLSLLRNSIASNDCEELKKIQNLLSTKDPLLKITDSSTDQK